MLGLVIHHRIAVNINPERKICPVQDTCCWAEYAGQHFTSAGQLAPALKKKTQASIAPHLYPFDHIYSNQSAHSFTSWQAGNASAAVLYGIPGTACFQEMHQILKDTTRLDPKGATASHSSVVLAGGLTVRFAAFVLVLLSV